MECGAHGDVFSFVMFQDKVGFREARQILADKAGIKHYFVEHDHPKDPFQSAKTSYEYLSKVRF